MNLRELGDLNLLTALIWGEARGEPIEGKIAVGWTVRNRVNSPRWGKIYPDVILQPKQFSCFNLDDPNHHEVLLRLLPSRNANMIDPTYRECRWVANGVLGSWVSDLSGGSNHYHRWDCTPYWSRGETPVKRIGAHWFFKL